MEGNIRSIIEQINQRNKKILFDVSKIDGIEHILNQQPMLEYLGHGVQSICFKTGKTHVIKCCIKRKSSIITSKNTFIAKVHELLDLKMPILPPIEVLYENDIWMIYTQPFCRMIDDLNIKICHTILTFVKQMIETNIRISDIYHRNFGIYQNKILLFDYHDIDNFDSSSNFLITNLYTLFNILGKKLGWNVLNTPINHWDKIVADHFGKTRFPSVIVDMLQSFNSRDHEMMIKMIDQTLLYLKKYLKQNLTTYHHLNISDEGTITLSYPHKIYDLIFDLVKNQNMLNILDVHSVDTGIGMKLAQDFPNLIVTLGCSNNEEVHETRVIINNCLTYNTSIIYANMVDIKPSVNDRYDLILYYASFYQLLQTHKISELLQIVKNQASRYIIIEVPVIGDSALVKLIENSKNANYGCLTTPFVLRNHLCFHKIKVNRMIYVDYGVKQLQRYLFFCSL